MFPDGRKRSAPVKEGISPETTVMMNYRAGLSLRTDLACFMAVDASGHYKCVHHGAGSGLPGSNPGTGYAQRAFAIQLVAQIIGGILLQLRPNHHFPGIAAFDNL